MFRSIHGIDYEANGSRCLMYNSRRFAMLTMRDKHVASLNLSISKWNLFNVKFRKKTGQNMKFGITHKGCLYDV